MPVWHTPAIAADGDLDTAFGTGGKVTTAIGSSDDRGYSVALQSDGKVVVAGDSWNGSNNDVAVVRYHSDGTLDTTFGTGGKVTTAIGSSNDSGYSVTLQSDGKVVVAGDFDGSNPDVAVVRYNSNGTLDTTFGTGGKVTTAIGSGNDSSYSVALQSDGKVVVAGYSSNGSNNDVAVVRYNSNGTLDTTFGTGGKVTTAIGSNTDFGYSVALQSDGKVIVAGDSWNGSNNDVAVVRYHSDGTLDTTFGTGGKVTTAIGSSDDSGYSVALQSDGKVVVAGYSSNGSNYDVAVVRYLVTLNSAPVATADSYNTTKNTTLTVVAATGVLANDTDADNDPLTANLGTAVSHGTLTLNADGSLVYTPTANWSGTDSFTYYANDGTVNSTAATTVTITVNATNSAPVATADTYNTTENTTLRVAATGVLANDTDADNDPLTATWGTAVSHGTLTLNADGSLVYTPTANWSGMDSFTYFANDGTVNSTAAVTVTITVNAVNAVNQAPTLTTIPNQTLRPNTATAALAITVADVETAVALLTLSGSSSNTTLVPNENLLFGGFGANRTITVTPAANQTGTATITVTVSDGNLSTPTTFTVTVTPAEETATQTSTQASTPPLPENLGLFVQVDGNGHGRVSTDTGMICQSSDCQVNPAGEFDCNPQVCTQLEDTGTYVTLTPQADSDSVFSSWGGSEDCVDGKVFMNSSHWCIAYFHRTYQLTVTLQGQGQVTGYGRDQQPMGIVCGTQCRDSYSSGTTVYLYATPDEGMTFGGWNGDCQGTQNPLAVTVTTDLNCQATFLSPVPPPPVTTSLTTPVPPPETTVSVETTTPVIDSPVSEVPTLPPVTLPVTTAPVLTTPPVETSLPIVATTPTVVTTPVIETTLPVETIPPPVAPTPSTPTPVTVAPPDVALPATPVVTPSPMITATNFSCPTTGQISDICNYGGREVTHLEVLERGMVSNGVLKTTLVNHGWVSNFTITATGKLSGGVVTGYLKNDGMMRDFEFRGASIIGGTLGGTIRNTSSIGGYFQDVTFLADTKVIGGILKGRIKGEKNSPAVLEKVRVRTGSHLSGVKLGKDVKLEKGVIVEE